MRRVLFTLGTLLSLSTVGAEGGSYRVEVKELPSVPIAYMAGKATSEDEIHVVVPRIFKTVKAYLKEQGAYPEHSPPFIRFLKYDGGEILVEAGWPILGTTFKETSEIRLGKLAAGAAATTVHVGNYKNLDGANRAIRSWLEQNHKVPAGPHWNRITNNPLEVSQNEIRTEVYYPIR